MTLPCDWYNIIRQWRQQAHPYVSLPLAQPIFQLVRVLRELTEVKDIFFRFNLEITRCYICHNVLVTKQVTISVQIQEVKKYTFDRKSLKVILQISMYIRRKMITVIFANDLVCNPIAELSSCTLFLRDLSFEYLPPCALMVFQCSQMDFLSFFFFFSFSISSKIVWQWTYLFSLKMKVWGPLFNKLLLFFNLSRVINCSAESYFTNSEYLSIFYLQLPNLTVLV